MSLYNPQMIGERGNIQRPDLNLVMDWIKFNQSKLLAVWTNEIDLFQANFRRVRYAQQAHGAQVCRSSLVIHQQALPVIGATVTGSQSSLQLLVSNL